MTTLDISQLIGMINNFVKERDWDQFHSIKNLSMAMSVECSELVEIFQWMDEASSNKIGENPVKSEKVREEIADIFYYLLRISDKLGINLSNALEEKIIKNGLKYPVEKFKGSAKKYDEED